MSIAAVVSFNFEYFVILAWLTRSIQCLGTNEDFVKDSSAAITEMLNRIVII